MCNSGNLISQCYHSYHNILDQRFVSLTTTSYQNISLNHTKIDKVHVYIAFQSYWDGHNHLQQLL